MSKSDITAAQMAKYIDHTILKTEATEADVDRICQEALNYAFAAVCVNSCHVNRVAQALKGSEVQVCSVIGFPLGAMATAAKAGEAQQAVSDGATEIDMVLNVGWFKSGSINVAEADIKAVKKAIGSNHLKVIIETCLLSDEEKVKACQIAQSAGADYVKTSTGFSSGGATVEDIALMRNTVGPDMGVKASGGIGDWDKAAAMVRAGATRIGASAGIAIVGGAPE